MISELKKDLSYPLKISNIDLNIICEENLPKTMNTDK